MINQEQAIPCPSCNTKIPFDVYQLLAGAKFTCPTCYASIGLPTDFVESLPTGLMKPFSGSGSRALMLESFETYGVDILRRYH